MSISMCQDSSQTEIAVAIDDGYSDGFGNWHDTSSESRQAILSAMDPDSFDVNQTSVWILREGEALVLGEKAENARLILESGEQLEAKPEIPEGLPIGYHRLERDAGAEGDVETKQTIHLIVAPSCCHLEPTMRIWGWAAQLYAVRSSQSWGIGDFSDLAQLAEFSDRLGAGVVQVNPLGASSPGLSQIDSPYFPTSRRFINPLYLDVSRLANELGMDVSEHAQAAKKLNSERLIDRDEVYRQKFAALEKLFAPFQGSREFDDFCDTCDIAFGPSTLHQFASFCAYAEQHGGDYRNWDAEFQSADFESKAWQSFVSGNERRITFFKWLQWNIDRQFGEAAKIVDIANDLPIGFDPGGFDAWQWQDVIAKGATIGAPPDAFNTDGQNWAIPPFIPHKLRAAGYRPFIETIRANLRHARGLRIDHVMGLYRLFWIPSGMNAADGTYVQYRSDEMLAILAIESQRAQAWIAGEDLGTVPEGMREQMDRMNILSHRLAIFEQDPPSGFPHKTLAAISTHDLPTLAGLWNGTDIQAVRDMGRNPNEADYEYMLDCLRRLTDSSPDESANEVIRRAYETFKSAPSAVVLAGLEDALCVEERPNMPGTIDEWPNWRIALPVSLEEIIASEDVAEFARSASR